MSKFKHVGATAAGSTPAGDFYQKIGRIQKMYALYYKELYITKEPLTKNRTCQTWRGKQLAICEAKEPLQDYINNQKRPEKFYIEKLGF